MAWTRTKPRRLEVPCALRTLGRLQQALREHHGRDVTPATIRKWLQAQGVVWKRQQSWFPVEPEAALAEQRGVSSTPTPSPSRNDGSSAWTHAGRCARRPLPAGWRGRALAAPPAPPPPAGSPNGPDRRAGGGAAVHARIGCWLNLLEPWWKPWRRLALNGRRCEHVDGVIEAIVPAVAYRNAHRDPSVWKKAASLRERTTEIPVQNLCDLNCQ
jgi:hypothetical protein